MKALRPFRPSPSILMALMLAGLVMSAQALAEASADADEKPTQTQMQYGDWTVVCQGDDLQDCRAMQTLNYRNESGTGRLMSATVRKVVEGPLMMLELPFGLDLRAGIVVRFDKNDEIPLPFTVCLTNGCQVITLLAPEHEDQFLNAYAMRVGFRPFGQEETVVGEFSLKGSAAAMRSLPTPKAPPTEED